MPDLEPTRMSSGTEHGPRPCVFEPPAWNWSKSDDTGWWVRADWASALLHEGRLPLDEWKQSRAGSPRSSEGRTGSSTGPTCPRGRSTSSTSSCPTSGPRPASGSAAARGGTKGGGPPSSRRSASRRSPRSPSASAGSAGSSSRTTWSPRRSPTPCPLDEFVERQLPLMPPGASGAAPPRPGPGPRRPDRPAPRRRLRPPGLPPRQPPDPARARRLAPPGRDRPRRPPGHPPPELGRRPREPGPPEPLFLEPVQPIRPLSLPPRLSRRPAASPPRPSARGLSRDIERSTRAWAERLWRRWGRRCWSKNKYFNIHRKPGLWAVASRDLDPSSLEPILADPEADLRPRRDDRSSRIRGRPSSPRRP